MSGFCFLADATKLVIVQFKMQGVGSFERAKTALDFLDFSVPVRRNVAGEIVRDGPESLVFSTSVIDVQRQCHLPNPLSLYLRHQKESLSSGDALGAKKDGASMAFDSPEDLPQLVGDMDALLR
jgi:hypothetical protein